MFTFDPEIIWVIAVVSTAIGHGWAAEKVLGEQTTRARSALTVFATLVPYAATTAAVRFLPLSSALQWIGTAAGVFLGYTACTAFIAPASYRNAVKIAALVAAGTLVFVAFTLGTIALFAHLRD